MKRKLVFLPVLLVTCLALALWIQASATTVFSDDFSSGGFAAWSASISSSGSRQAVTDGVAHFSVPTPVAGQCTSSFVLKHGFTSTANSTIIASQDVYIAKVPSGCPPENGAIFFLYLCDSTDLHGAQGNFGVGIDGSQAWSLWLGGNTSYTYLLQSNGAAPVSAKWYHLALLVDNTAGSVALYVDGLVVINATQTEFTSRTRPVTLIVGMGEDWWSNGGPGVQEIAVDNVNLYISDGSEPVPTPQPPVPTQSEQLSQNNNGKPTQQPNVLNPTTAPTAMLTATASPQEKPETTIQAIKPNLAASIVLITAPLIAIFLVSVATMVWVRKKFE